MPARKPDVRRSGLNATDAAATDGPPPVPPRAPTPGAGDAFFLVTCEHGGNQVPTPFQALFDGHEALLVSHRGHDPGALAVARDLAAALGSVLAFATVTRLLVDLNRSPGHRARFSELTRTLPPARRAAIDELYYLPYRERVEGLVAQALALGRKVVHVSSHSFTPVVGGHERNADVAFLYDPQRPDEVELCTRWLNALRVLAPNLRIRRNYPYTGRADGFCAYLRRRYPATLYIGVELELNQRHVRADDAAWRPLRTAIVASLLSASEHPQAAPPP